MLMLVECLSHTAVSSLALAYTVDPDPHESCVGWLFAHLTCYLLGYCVFILAHSYSSMSPSTLPRVRMSLLISGFSSIPHLLGLSYY